jgi:phosphopantothenoylcysteine synthetase/decarboxylase
MNAPTNQNDDQSSTPSTSTPQYHIVLGITGGIAAYKCAELTRLLVKAGMTVTVVMTKSAQQFVTPVTLQALSGNKVFTDLWDADVPNNMAHIELTRRADCVLIAPATGDFMAKVAHGLADDLLSTLCLARNVTNCPPHFSLMGQLFLARRRAIKRVAKRAWDGCWNRWRFLPPSPKRFQQKQTLEYPRAFSSIYG